MKHSKEWHTCDRCGAEIKQGLLRKRTLTFENSLLPTIKYDLCYRCAEDFERFMQNEEVKE